MAIVGPGQSQGPEAPSSLSRGERAPITWFLFYCVLGCIGRVLDQRGTARRWTSASKGGQCPGWQICLPTTMPVAKESYLSCVERMHSIAYLSFWICLFFCWYHVVQSLLRVRFSGHEPKWCSMVMRRNNWANIVSLDVKLWCMLVHIYSMHF